MDIKAFIQSIPSRAKNFAGYTYYFVTSRVFLKNFGVLAGIFLTVMTILFWFLGCYTHHGEKLTVPDLVNMPLAQAQELVSKNHLEIFVMDSFYRRDKPAGVILLQDPGKDAKVKRSRRIYVTINKVKADMKTISPDIVKKGFDQVKMILERNHFEVIERPRPGTIAGEVYSLSVDGNIIYEYGKTANAKEMQFPEGTKIVVSYSEGPGAEAEIPQLVGLPFGEAKFVVINSDLNLGTVTTDASVGSDSSEAIVWKQSPDKNALQATMRKGQAINLWISKTQKPSGNQ